MHVAVETHRSYVAPTAGRTGSLTALKQAWADFREGNLTRKAAQETVQALAELDDKGLADIGLHRSQILSIAMDPKALFR